jgi:hypothetical protein
VRLTKDPAPAAVTCRKFRVLKRTVPLAGLGLSKHPCSVTRPRSRYAFCEPFRLFMYARATRPPGDDATLSSASDMQDDYWPRRSTRGEGSPVSWWGRNGYEGFVLMHTVGCWVGVVRRGKGRRSRTMFSPALVLWRRPRRVHRQPRARVCTMVVFCSRAERRRAERDGWRLLRRQQTG